jgi:hypothetical protein
MSPAEAIAYIRSRNVTIGERTYFKYKSEIEKQTWDRAKDIAKGGLLEQHIQRIDNLETIEHEQWISLNMERRPSQRSMILERIAVLQPYITAMYDSTRMIMEKQVELTKAFTDGKVSEQNSKPIPAS